MDSGEAYRGFLADSYELISLSRSTSERLARAAGETVPRWHVMSALSEYPMTVSQVGRRLGLARQSVQRVVNDLRDEVLIRGRANPDHKASPIFELTSSGKEVLTILIGLADRERASEVHRAGVSVDELQHAQAIVRSLITSLTSGLLGDGTTGPG